MLYEKLHDSTHPNAEHLDRLCKNIEVGYENLKNAMVDYQKVVGVTTSDVFENFKGLNNHYKMYKREFKGTIENSDYSDEDFMDNRDFEDVDNEIENDDCVDEKEDSYDEDYIEYKG